MSINGLVITVYDKMDSKLSEEDELELKSLLDSIDWDEVFKPQPFKKPKVLHNYRLKLDGTNEVEHWTTELELWVNLQ